MIDKTKQEEIIELFVKVHGDKYDYSQVIYVKRSGKVDIICRKHGIFSQTVSNHLAGKGCLKCANEKTSERCRSNSVEFLSKARKAHGDFYNYSKVEYKTTHSKVIITCPVHGDFSQKPSHHQAGVGCPHCGKESTANKLTLGREEFIRRARDVHGNKYSYDNVKYKNFNSRVTLSCPRHGDWDTLPSNVLQGSGCFQCSSENRKINPRLSHTLYVVIWENITKVGITNRDISYRLAELLKESGKNFKVLKEFKDLERWYCFQLEADILKLLRESYYPITESFIGSTECFEDVNLAWLLNTIEDKINHARIERRYGN